MPKSAYEYVKAWRARPENKGKRAAEARRWRAKHPEKMAAIKRAYRERHPDRVKTQDAKTIARRKADPEGQRRRMEKWRAKREAELRILAGRPRPTICDLCRENNGGIVFDHCHTSGLFRGWLCDRCNKVLGLMRDNPALLSRMARYLEKARGKTQHKREKEIAEFLFCGTEPQLSR